MRGTCERTGATPDPACSAIMTRSYHDLRDFPVWFFNLPPGERKLAGAARSSARRDDTDDGSWIPERAATPASCASIQRARVATDHLNRWRDQGAATSAIEPGLHRVGVDAILRGGDWRFEPSWNGTRSVVDHHGDREASVDSRPPGPSGAELDVHASGCRAAADLDRVDACPGPRRRRARLGDRRVAVDRRARRDGADPGGAMGDLRARRRRRSCQCPRDSAICPARFS